MSPLNAAEIAAGNGVEIFTVGVGDPSGEGAQRVDASALEDIASRAGGRFFFADDEEGLENVYSRIDEMSPRKIETLSFRPRQSLGFLPLAAAALVGLMGATGIHLRSVWRSAG
jgi:Ca-activated chloride channel family protein